MAKKKKDHSSDEVLEIVDIVKNASAGKKDSVERDDIKNLLDLILLERVHKAFDKKGNEKAFLKVMGLTAKRWEKIFALIKHYKILIDPPKGTDDRAYEESFLRFARALGEFADFKVKTVTRSGMSCLLINFVNPPLECMKGDLLFLHSRGDSPAQEIQKFTNIIESGPQEYLRKVAYIVAFNHLREFERIIQNSRYKFVLLSTSSLKEVVVSPNPQVEFNAVTTCQLDLLDIQPYRTHGSTSSLMFFGRKREIDYMLNDPGISFALYGGRQLGKTSLLRKIQEILDEDKTQTTVFVTCEGIVDNLALGLEILKQLSVDTSDVATIHDFERVFRDYLRTQKNHHTIFIDEVDDLVDIDRQAEDKIFVSLRNLYNDFRGKCRFFFAGFKKLYSEFYRLYAPFRNFAEPCELKSLPKRDAKRLIEEPLGNRLGIQFVSKRRVLEKVYEYTGGHPAFIQHYCKCLIERISLDHRRIITEEDLDEVYRSAAYRNLVIGNHSDNFKEGEEDGEVIPKLVVCHIIFEELDTFSENDLLQSLAKKADVVIEPFLLRSELRKLTMTSVLERQANLYRFSNSVYPRMLREGERLDDILIQLMEKYQNMVERQLEAQPTRANNDRFILREEDLNQIVTDSERSYAIIGGQGFGKSSLLLNLQQLYEFDRSYKPILVRASPMASAQELAAEMMVEFDLSRGHHRENLAFIKEYIADEYQQGRRIVILIDDLDPVARKDSQGLREIVKIFEHLSAEFGEAFRCILVGGAPLHKLVSTKSIAKSMEILHLRPLDDRDARQLIDHVLKRKGHIRLEDDTLVDIILDYTGGNPSLIEKFCDMVEQKVDQPFIEEGDLDDVGESEEFQDHLLTVYEGEWSEDEQNLVAAMVQTRKERFTTSHVAKASGQDSKEIRDPISRLTLLGFLKRTGRTYRFSNPYYKECYQWRKENS